MNDDVIYRQAAIDILDAFEVKIENGEPFAYSWARMRITELHSAQLERPKGRWMLCDNQRREDIENGNYMYTCTNCLHSDVHAKTVTVPFCWYCGADMRGDSE